MAGSLGFVTIFPLILFAVVVLAGISVFSDSFKREEISRVLGAQTVSQVDTRVVRERRVYKVFGVLPVSVQVEVLVSSGDGAVVETHESPLVRAVDYLSP